jgi:hypothetical protein
MAYQHIKIPENGAKITANPDNSLNIPDNPIIPYIGGDGIGADITPVMQEVVDAAVEKAYGGKRAIAWMEIYAGEKATRVYDKDTWMPAETLEAVRDYLISIKGPLTTPVGGGIRSLNVALRQELDLYVCLRPVRYFTGTPSPLRGTREDRHGDLPRELRGHLRGDRVGVGQRRGAQGHRLPDQGDGREQDPLPRDQRHRWSSPSRGTAHGAWCARRSSTPSTTTATR